MVVNLTGSEAATQSGGRLGSSCGSLVGTTAILAGLVAARLAGALDPFILSHLCANVASRKAAARVVSSHCTSTTADTPNNA
jgi:hypothetical protein